MLVFPVILALMGAGFLVAGWQGFRIPLDPDGASGLNETELKRRRMMARGGSYACILSGTTLVLVAAIVAYTILTMLGTRPLLPRHPTLRHGSGVDAALSLRASHLTTPQLAGHDARTGYLYRPGATPMIVWRTVSTRGGLSQRLWPEPGGDVRLP